MPELPEVETVRRSLEKLISGLSIINSEVFMPKIVGSHRPSDFKTALVGRQVALQLERRGKYLIIPLSGNMVLVIHLRMTGRLVFLNECNDLPKYTHVLFYFNNGKRLAFADMRQFGRVNLLPMEELIKMSGLKDLGPEPLGDSFNQEYMHQELPRRRTKIKALLLNQSFVAGLGNIYVDEALHLAKIHPERLAQELSPDEINRLYQSIVHVIEQGIKNRGTSFRDYVDGEGNMGNNQNMLKAYNREGEQCLCCNEIISRKKVAGRSSYFCPHCQKTQV